MHYAHRRERSCEVMPINLNDIARERGAFVPLVATAQDLPLQTIKLPPGFKLNLYAANVEGARSMTLSPSGTLFVGTRLGGFRTAVGSVYAVLDRDKDGRADDVVLIARGLNVPNGVAFHSGALYVAEINRILVSMGSRAG